MALALGVGVGAPAVARPAAGTALSVADLDWPASTRAALTRRRATVYAAPRSGRKLGEVGTGVRLGWTEIVAGAGGCRAYLAIAPRGYVCASELRPVDEPPDPVTRGVGVAPTVLGEYADVRRGGADAFPSVEAIRGGAPSHQLTTDVFVAIKGSITVDGVAYHKTDQGYVAAARLARKTPSAFVGVDLIATPPPSWPMAWASAHAAGVRLVVRDRPAADGAVLEELAHHAIVPVLAEQDGFVEVGAGRERRRDARIARTSAPPAA
ncbi:MAG: hypothetical protein R2939_02785 [Kofleriaceae bacterium]